MSEITGKQREYLTHMLGAEPHIHQSQWGYRNYYCAGVGGNDERDLMAMAELGLVKRCNTINEGTSVYFKATELGMDAIRLTPAQKLNTLR